MQTNDPALNASYWQQVRETNELREAVQDRDMRIAELERELAAKRGPSIELRINKADVRKHLQGMWDLCGYYSRFHDTPEQNDARLAALDELAKRLLGEDHRGFESLC